METGSLGALEAGDYGIVIGRSLADELDADVGDRYDAREIIDENLELLELANQERKRILQIGYRLGDVKVKKASRDGISFKVEVKNGTDGHNVPTGFDAERIVYLQVTVTDANGKVVFKSGDLDPNGDLRDAHSLYVHNGELPMDKYLFNLQSKFVTRMIRGGEREQVLLAGLDLAEVLREVREPVGQLHSQLHC